MYSNCGIYLNYSDQIANGFLVGFIRCATRLKAATDDMKRIRL